MEVKLLTYTPLSQNIVAAAARGCYSDKPASQLMDKPIPAAHGSCFEHVSFTFSVEGVSRVLTHQLVRHRVGTAFSQQSMRYVDVHKLFENIVIPKTVQEMMAEYEAIADMAEEWGELTPMNKKESVGYLIHQYMGSLKVLIEAMTEAGIPSEDQRYFVPMGVKSNITVTMNARELQHFCGLRRCKRAQWEIRELADKMAELVQGACPELCQHLNLGAQCDQLGYCPEHRCCGKKLPLEQTIKLNLAERIIDHCGGPNILKECAKEGYMDQTHKYFGKFQR